MWVSFRAAGVSTRRFGPGPRGLKPAAQSRAATDAPEPLSRIARPPPPDPWGIAFLMSVHMTNDRWHATCEYLDTVFGREDDQLRTLMARAVEAGIPDIAVSASVGRLLTLLAKTANVRTAVEVGTLAGYSGIWIARGLAEGGSKI